MLDHWKSESLTGRSIDWFDPPVRPRFALLYLHPVGGERLADNAVFTRELLARNLACCAPHGGQNWWTEIEFLRTTVRAAMIDRWSIPQKAIAAAGISMGGQGALRLGFRHPIEFPVVAGIASAIDYYERFGRGSPLDDLYHSKEACRQDTATLSVRQDSFPKHIWFVCDPTDEEWIRGNDRLHEKLSAMGIPHKAELTTQEGGHSWSYFEAMAAPMLDFVLASLTSESRRLM